MKFLTIVLLVPTFLFANISQCIKSKMYELGATSYKGNSQKLSQLKNTATASCLNIRSSASVSSENIQVQPTVELEQPYQPSAPVQQSDGTFMDYSNDTPQLNGEWNDRITNKGSQKPRTKRSNLINNKDVRGHSRGISSVDENFSSCVKQTSYSLGAKAGMSSYRLNEIKNQATQRCLD